MSINRKLVLIFLVIAMIPILLIGILGFVNAKASLKRLTLEALNTTADFKEGEIFFYLENLKTRTSDFASDGYIRSVLESLIQDPQSGLAREKLNDHLLTNKKSLAEDIQFIDVLDLKGKVVASTEPDRVGLDLSKTESFGHGKEQSHIHETHEEQKKSLTLDVSTPIFSSERPYRNLGVLINRFYSSRINDILTGRIYLNLGAKTHPRGLGKTGETYLVSQDRHLISDSLFLANAAFHYKVNTYPVKKCLEENRESSGIWVDYRGKSVVGASMCIDMGHYKWVLISEQDTEEAFASINRLREFTIILGGLILLAAGLAAFLIARSLSGPILLLEKGAEIIGSGNLDHKVGTKRSDEIGRLSRAFDRMTENLKAVTASRDDLDQVLDQLKKSQAQLIHAEKMSAVGLMTAGVAHELNNPMMGLLNFVQYCLKHTPPEDKRHDVLKDAEKEILRCTEIVKNLLTFSRMEAEGAEAYQKMSCASLFQRVFKLLSYRIETERVVMSLSEEEGTPEVWMKTNSIQQVFLGLINNAMDAMKTSEKKEIGINIRPDGRMVRISVSDTGTGLSPQHLQRIFDPFFTTKPVGEGTGLGLSICHNIIQAHEGEITCRSALGKGTTFEVLLPVEKRRERGNG